MTEYEVIDRVAQIYETKEWRALEEDFAQDGSPLIFKNMVELCMISDPLDRELACQLMELIHVTRDYRKYAKKFMLDIQLIQANFSKVVILPVRDPKDTENSSGNMITYQTVAFREPKYKQKIFDFLSPYDDQISVGLKDAVVFLDDFIGTGRQFEKMIIKFKEIHNPKAIYLKSIVIMNESIERIKTYGVEISSIYSADKAISS
ncbi:hypothetical protein, partial [Caulobacter sp. B11]|uniref:phosphoribosyltransferase-like protein n=1 Tax=Caulobacter sp. B11 TaxID=2048899 RepID=UPI00191BC860